MTILKLSAATYPIGSWQYASPAPSPEESSESWSLRSTLAAWSWRAIAELRGDEEARES